MKRGQIICHRLEQKATKCQEDDALLVGSETYTWTNQF